MEFHLRTDPTFSTNIILRFTKDADNHDLDSPFDEDFRSGLTTLTSVKNGLKDAQDRILGGHPTANATLDGLPNQRRLSFSENCVIVEVQGPNVPELYFYDLPGEDSRYLNFFS